MGIKKDMQALRKGKAMKKLILTAVAASFLVPATFAVPTSSAEARRYAYKEWRGNDGRVYCRRSNGTVGLVVGGAAGALVGRGIDTHGERTTGTVLGAAAGALLGREIDRKRRCR